MTVDPAVAGRAIRLPILKGGVETWQDVIVLSACADKTNGHWACVTHPGARFAHNFDKDTHINDSKVHELVWVCHEHGPEQP